MAVDQRLQDRAHDPTRTSNGTIKCRRCGRNASSEELLAIQPCVDTL